MNTDWTYDGRVPVEMSPSINEADTKRFWSHVIKGDGCWGFGLSHKGTNGYGRMRAAGRMMTAHRISYLICKGPIPAEFVVDHLCRNRGCVNPDHLEAIPFSLNIIRGETIANKYLMRDACAQGHPFTPENTRPHKDGFRVCRECDRTRKRGYLKVRKIITRLAEAYAIEHNIPIRRRYKHEEISAMIELIRNVEAAGAENGL